MYIYTTPMNKRYTRFCNVTFLRVFNWLYFQSRFSMQMSCSLFPSFFASSSSLCSYMLKPEVTGQTHCAHKWFISEKIITSANVLLSTAIKWAQMKHFHANVWFWLIISLRYDPKTSQFTSIRPFYYVAIVSGGPYQQARIIFMYFILSLMTLWYVCTKNTLFRLILDPRDHYH